jgi:hypothetical protein
VRLSETKVPIVVGAFRASGRMRFVGLKAPIARAESPVTGVPAAPTPRKSGSPEPRASMGNIGSDSQKRLRDNDKPGGVGQPPHPAAEQTRERYFETIVRAIPRNGVED